MKMKTVISVLLSLLLAFTLLPVSAFAAPASDGTQDALMLIFGIEVAPYENGSVEVSSERGSTGSDITVTATADEGYVIESVSAVGESGAECELTENEGVYSFKMPSEAVVVTVVFAAAGETEPEEPVLELPFEDVAATDPYYADICYVYEAQLMNGIGGALFAPNNYMTRAMAATVLARIDGLERQEHIAERAVARLALKREAYLAHADSVFRFGQILVVFDLEFRLGFNHKVKSEQ